jgi:hypothetical protein
MMMAMTVITSDDDDDDGRRTTDRSISSWVEKGLNNVIFSVITEI